MDTEETAQPAAPVAACPMCGHDHKGAAVCAMDGCECGKAV